MKIVFSLASRGRLANLNRAIKSIFDNAINPNFIIYVILDIDDPAVSHLATASFETDSRIIVNWGQSKSKIDAINRFSSFVGNWDILVNVSDDQVFTLKGFDNVIRQNMPSDLDAFLHFRDTNHNPPDALCTLSILGRKYYERDHFIYDPRFKSYFCDNLAQDVAKARGKYLYVPNVIFQHLHPSYHASVPQDEQYKANDKNWKQDELTYMRLKRQIKSLI